MEDLKQISHFRFWPKKGNANSLSFFQSQLCFTSDLRLTFSSELQIRQGSSVCCDSSPHFLLIGCMHLWKKLFSPKFWSPVFTLDSLTCLLMETQIVKPVGDNYSSEGVWLQNSVCPIFVWLCNRKESEANTMGQLRPSWVFVPIFHCQVLWKFSTMSICALPLSGFVDFQIQDLWTSTARICGTIY